MPYMYHYASFLQNPCQIKSSLKGICVDRSSEPINFRKFLLFALYSSSRIGNSGDACYLLRDLGCKPLLQFAILHSFVYLCNLECILLEIIASGERMIDFMNLDERSMGMFWVLSFTMAQPACDAVMNWFTSAGGTEFMQGPNMQPNERMTMMRETYPLSMSLLSGLSINLCLKLAFQLEETIFLGQVKLFFFCCYYPS